MKKQILSFLLIACMLLGVIPQFAMTAFAENYSGTCGENLTWELDSATGVLTISGSGGMKNYDFDLSVPWYSYTSYIKSAVISDGVTTIGDCAFFGCNSLASVTIPDSVTSIGEEAFRNCYALSSVTIGENVTSIGREAFYSCTSLTSVTIPDSVTSIGEAAYRGCNHLLSVTLGKRITSIGDSAFEDCSRLTSVTIPDSVTSIGNYAFYNCCDMTSATIGDGVTTIGDYAFDSCDDLASLTIGDSVTSIGNSAFSWCQSLTSVTIPDSVTYIGDNAFGVCSNLISINVDAANQYYASDSAGVLFNKDMTELIQCPMGFSGAYTIPDGVVTIGDSAFYWCESLTSVTIPDGVVTIGDYAFFRCFGMTSVTIPNSVRSIGARAFEDCYGLTSVTIGDGEMQIPSRATGTGVALTSIGDYAFSGCDKLTDVYYGGTKKQWDKIEIGEGNELLLAANIHFNESSNDDAEPPIDDNPPSVENPFVDVKENDYFFTPVLWAVQTGITNGTSATKFSPEKPCTRGQIVTFLWRASGSPEPKTTVNPFSDIKEKDYYYKAVLWAVEKGITTGTGKGRFSPDSECTRAQVATFLWRAQGEPVPTTTQNTFADVVQGSYYYKAVLWAVENGITNGTGKGKFSPDNSCTRGQIVTFLYRALS